MKFLKKKIAGLQINIETNTLNCLFKITCFTLYGGGLQVFVVTQITATEEMLREVTAQLSS